MLSAQTNGATMIFGKPHSHQDAISSSCAPNLETLVSVFSVIMGMHIHAVRKRQTDGQF